MNKISEYVKERENGIFLQVLTATALQKDSQCRHIYNRGYIVCKRSRDPYPRKSVVLSLPSLKHQNFLCSRAPRIPEDLLFLRKIRSSPG